MEVIGRSLDSTFDGHWGVIGGHWRSLVKNLHKTVHIVADSAHSANNTKTYAKHDTLLFNDRKSAPNIFSENPGDLNAL